MDNGQKLRVNLQALRIKSFDTTDPARQQAGTVHGLDCTDCSNCTGCSNCSGCSNCTACSNCSGCSMCSMSTAVSCDLSCLGTSRDDYCWDTYMVS